LLGTGYYLIFAVNEPLVLAKVVAEKIDEILQRQILVLVHVKELILEDCVIMAVMTYSLLSVENVQNRCPPWACDVHFFPFPIMVRQFDGRTTEVHQDQDEK